LIGVTITCVAVPLKPVRPPLLPNINIQARGAHYPPTESGMLAPSPAVAWMLTNIDVGMPSSICTSAMLLAKQWAIVCLRLQHLRLRNMAGTRDACCCCCCCCCWCYEWWPCPYQRLLCRHVPLSLVLLLLLGLALSCSGLLLGKQEGGTLLSPGLGSSSLLQTRCVQRAAEAAAAAQENCEVLSSLHSNSEQIVRHC